MKTKKTKDEEDQGRRRPRTKKTKDEEDQGRRRSRTKKTKDEEDQGRRRPRTKTVLKKINFNFLFKTYFFYIKLFKYILYIMRIAFDLEKLRKEY